MRCAIKLLNESMEKLVNEHEEAGQPAKKGIAKQCRTLK